MAELLYSPCAAEAAEIEADPPLETPPIKRQLRNTNTAAPAADVPHREQAVALSRGEPFLAALASPRLATRPENRACN